MTSWNDTHTTVLWCRIVYGEPQRYHLHRLQRPVGTVLMPKHGTAIAWRLADVGGRKKRNVRSDEFLRDVQKAVVADESHPERIIRDEFSTKMLGPLLWVLGLQPFDVVLRFAHERLIQHVSKHRETVSFITGYRVEHFNPRNYLSHLAAAGFAFAIFASFASNRPLSSSHSKRRATETKSSFFK